MSHAAFVQDDFKVTSKLTLNLGFRYDFGRPREEARGRLRGFDPAVPNPAAGGRLSHRGGAIGQGGLQAENFGLVEPDRTNFGPRFGFAYLINEKTVVRGGYGIYYAPIIYNDFGNAGARLQPWCSQYQWRARCRHHARKLSEYPSSRSEFPSRRRSQSYRSRLLYQGLQNWSHARNTRSIFSASFLELRYSSWVRR